MKKILVIGTAIVTGLSFGLSHAEEGDKGKGKGKGDPGKRAEMMLKKLDTDENGTLSKEEFAAGPIGEKMKDKEGAIDKIFAARDKNNDGELDKDELAAPPKGKGKGDGKGKGKGKGKGGDE